MVYFCSCSKGGGICRCIQKESRAICLLQLRSYDKAELALLYHPCSTSQTAMKTLYHWIKGCPMLVSELESMNYNPNRRIFLCSEVEAIVRHLGAP